MIGNDVVDLQVAALQSNWRRKGFLEKVFTPSEQAIIKSTSRQDLMVWLLWSMKEAAYKAHQRRISLPRRLNWKVQQCNILSMDHRAASGEVKIGNLTYFTTSEILESYIHTSAGTSYYPALKRSVFEAPSKTAKNRLLMEIANHFSIPSEELEIGKNTQGVPVILQKNHIVFTHFSLSSHGKFSAFTSSLINC
ncbi:4'-phosphopantetheinyl transferase family protein [Salinimicrobium flavum]|uniref:4'-phosphopantetheinyl transferase superfamily protein n=1 Tax=Salinimicrobium flavum TaxID=1737065 RepID=A0ABW5IZ10_9FLAO